MIRRNRTFKGITVGIATMMGYAELAHGGWTGGVNGLGNGWTQGSVVSRTGISAVARTPFRSMPSSAIPPISGFVTNRVLPTGSSTATLSWVKASPGVPYNMTANAVPTNGDGVDNKEIKDKGINIKPAKCPSLTMTTSQESFDPATGNGSLKVNTQGTVGTALLLRGFEVDDWTLIPSDNPNTPEDESVDWLKQHGALKFESFIIGPFNYGNGTCELFIPFSLEGKNTDNFIVTTDGAAYSEPSLHFTCPPDQTVTCLTDYQYPSVAPTSDCSVGPVQSYELKYEPDESALQVGENAVTLTVTELLTNGDKGVSSTCTFKVKVLAEMAPTPPVLPDVIESCGGIGVTLTRPTATDNCGTITGTTTTVFPITATGTTIVTWAFTDSAGNTAYAEQKVIIGGYTFIGFYEPISASGGSCSVTAKDIKVGSKVPVKFDFKCGSQFITTGPVPVVGIQQLTGNCSPTGAELRIPANYQNNWHSNWDTTGSPRGKYKITAYLPDGTIGVIYINLVK